MKSLNEYQEAATVFARYHHPDYPFLGLAEEAGEVMGKVAKYVRKHDTTLNNALFQAKNGREGSHKELRAALAYELGDCLWMVQACCTELGMSLEEVASININKLQLRPL